MTPEEIARKYVSDSSIEDEERKPKKIKAQPAANSPESIASRYVSEENVPTTPPPAPPVEAEAGFFERSGDTLQLGLSDAMSTLMGDSYGRNYMEADNPLARSELDAASRVQTALGGDMIPALGDVAADAIGEIIPDSVKEGLASTMKWMGENKASHPLYSDASYTGGLDQYVDALPDPVANEVRTKAEELANLSLVAPIAKLPGSIINAIPSLPEKKPGTRAERKAYDFIGQNIQDAPGTQAALEAYLRNHSREVGTLADITGDHGIYNIETGATLDPRFRSVVRGVDKERQVQIAGELRAPFGDGIPGNSDVAAAQAIARANIEVGQNTKAATQLINENLDEATEKIRVGTAENELGLKQAVLAEKQGMVDQGTAQEAAREAALPLATGKRPAVESAEIYEILTEARAAAKADADGIWDEFKSLPDVPMVEVVESARRIFKGPTITKLINESVQEVYKKSFYGKFGIEEWTAEMAGADIHNWVRVANAKIDRRFEAGKGTEADHAMRAFVNEIDAGLAAQNDVYGRAKAATTDIKNRFDRGQSGQALANSEPEQFIEKAGGYADTGGAVLARKLLDEAKTPGMEQQVIDGLKSQAARNGLDDNFMMQYGDVFDALPDKVRSDFQRAIDAGAGEVAAGKKVTALAKATAKVDVDTSKANLKLSVSENSLRRAALKEADKARSTGEGLSKSIARSWLGRYAENSHTAFTDLLKPGQGRHLGALYESLKELGEGDAFKAALGERIRKEMTVGSNTETKVLPSSRGKFDKIREVLEDSGILTQKEIDGIATSLEKTKSIEKRGLSWAEKASQLENQLDEFGGAGATALALKLLPGSSLVLATSVGKFVRKILPKITGGNTKEMAALENFLKNPEAYAKFGVDAKTPDEQVSQILTEVLGAELTAKSMSKE